MKPLHVLVVDDHRLFRMGIISALKGLRPRWIFSEAENGQDALDLILKERAVQLVLLDIAMPVLNGIETCKQLKQTLPSLPVIMVTQSDEAAVILHLLQLGANSYLLKDTAPETVIEAIDTVLETGHYVTPRMVQVMQSAVGVAPENRAHIDLSPRDKELIKLLCKGMSTKEIASQLHLTETSIESYRKDLLHKTRSHNVAELISLVYRAGLVHLPSENRAEQRAVYVDSSTHR